MKSTKIIFIFNLVSIIFIIKSNAQGLISDDKQSPVIYVEAYGNNMAYSLNYEGILRSGATVITTYRAGIGGFPNRFGIPIGIHFLKGNNGKYLDMGIGLTYAYGSQVISQSTEKQRGKGIFFSPTIGYRRQLQKKLFFRVNAGLNIKMKEYNQVLGKSGFLPVMGLSFGYSFER